MKHVAVGYFGVAALLALLIVHFDRGRAIQIMHQTPEPSTNKSDRLPLPEIEPLPPVEPPPLPRIILPPIEPPPKTVVTERVVEPKPHDAVCGTKGRTYYTRENGWKYWRCNK